MPIKPKTTKPHLPNHYPILVDISLGRNQFWSCRADERRYTCSYGTIGEPPTKSVTTYKNGLAALVHANSAFHNKRRDMYFTITVGDFRRLWRIAQITGSRYKIEQVTLVRRPLSDEGGGLNELDPSAACNPSVKPLALAMVSDISKPKTPIHVLVDNDRAWMLHGCRELMAIQNLNKHAIGIIWPESLRRSSPCFYEHNWEYKKATIIDSSHRLHKLVGRVRQAIATMV